MEKEREEEPLTLEGEIWKPVVGYEEFYDVSNLGRVRNKGWRHGQRRSNVIIKQRIQRGGYISVKLSKDKKRRSFLVHRLVYEAFNRTLPKFEFKGKGHCDEVWEINHIDENKQNNRIENLELVTKTQNIRHGTGIRRRAMKMTKPVYQYTLDRKFVKFWEGGAPEIFKLGYNKSCISECCRGVQKYYRGFLWSYVPL